MTGFTVSNVLRLTKRQLAIAVTISADCSIQLLPWCTTRKHEATALRLVTGTTLRSIPARVQAGFCWSLRTGRELFVDKVVAHGVGDRAGRRVHFHGPAVLHAGTGHLPDDAVFEDEGAVRHVERDL